MVKKRFLTNGFAAFALLFIIGFSVLTGYAEEINNVNILSVNGISKELLFNNVNTSGPSSFYVVTDNEVYIADTYSHSIKHYVNGVLSNSINIPESVYIVDFCISDSKIYILDESCTENIIANTIIITDMSGEVINSIPVPNDAKFMGYTNLNMHFRAEEISIEDGIIAVKLGPEDVIRYHDNQWKLDLSIKGMVQNLKDKLLVDKYFPFYTVNKLSYTEMVGHSDSITYVFAIETTQSEDAYYKRIYRVSGMQNIYMATLLNPYSKYLPRREFLIKDEFVYQMLCDNERNLRIVKIPFIKKPDVKQQSEPNYIIDFSADKFDKVEVVSGESYVDITEYWNSFQKFISASWFRYQQPASSSLATEPNITEGNSIGCIRFIKDNEVYYATAYMQSHNSFGGYDTFYVRHNDVMYIYEVSNIALFHRAFVPIRVEDSILTDNAVLLKPSVYDIMCDSALLIRKMNSTDDICYWGQEKYAVISAIVNQYTKTLDNKPDDLKKYGIIRNYTYVYSSATKVDVSIYGLSLWEKGVYAHIKMNGDEAWLVLDTCVKDIQTELNNINYYRIPGLTQNMPALELSGYDTIKMIHNDKEYDITEIWPSYLAPVGLCDWAEYLKADAMETDCRVILEREGEQLVIDVARMYEYAVVNGKGIYEIPYIESIIDAVIESDLHKAADALTNRNVLYKMYRSSLVYEKYILEDRKGLSINKDTFEPIESLLIRHTETLSGKPDEEVYAWVEMDFFYKSEIIHMTVWRINDYGDVGYVNITCDGTNIWIKIQNAYLMFSYNGSDGWGNPWTLLDSLSEYVMVPYLDNK